MSSWNAWSLYGPPSGEATANTTPKDTTPKDTTPKDTTTTNNATNTSTNNNNNNIINNLDNAAMEENESKKRTSEEAGLKNKSNTKKNSIMAPRVARMSARGIKETAAISQKKANKNIPSNAASSLSNNVLPENEANPVDSKGTNLTQAMKAIKDPYDPAEPNDYQEYCKERMRKHHEKERNLVESQNIKEKEKPKGTTQSNTQNFNGVPGMSPIAEKLMKKMGWKGKGHGLGRQEQGMTAPLIAQKSGAGAQGIIIHADSNKQQPPPTPSTNAPVFPEVKGSNVIVLRNMVGPGEVDDMLCGETTRECMKYGQVLACEVWEDPTGQLPSNEAVRLFVKFEKHEQALQALADLDGRFFGGRNVKADLYAREKFDKLEFNEPILS